MLLRFRAHALAYWVLPLIKRFQKHFNASNIILKITVKQHSGYDANLVSSSVLPADVILYDEYAYQQSAHNLPKRLRVSRE
jgi:hypothetical protein